MVNLFSIDSVFAINAWPNTVDMTLFIIIIKISSLMSNHIKQIYEDMITYPQPKFNAGFAYPFTNELLEVK